MSVPDRDLAEMEREVQVLEAQIRIQKLRLEERRLEVEIGRVENTADELQRMSPQETSPQGRSSRNPTRQEPASQSELPFTAATPGVMEQMLLSMFESNRTIANTLARAHLPPVTIEKFTGNPVDYIRFKRNFEIQIGSVPMTSDERLTRLSEHTTGEPKKLVQQYSDWFTGSAEIAYRETWKALDKRYGESSVVADNLHGQLVNFPAIGKDPIKLRTFADLCQSVRVQMEVSGLKSLDVLNFPSTLKGIAAKLPYNLQTKWLDRGYTYKRRTSEEYPPFSEFTEFVLEVTEKMNDPALGAISHPKPDTHPIVKSATNWNTSEKYTASAPRRNLHTTRPLKTNVHQPQQQRDNGGYCAYHETSTHDLLECSAFASKPIPVRRDILGRNGYCYRCYSGRHRASGCDAIVSCAKCGQPHATLLHPTQANGDNRQTPMNTAPSGQVQSSGGPTRQSWTNAKSSPHGRTQQQPTSESLATVRQPTASPGQSQNTIVALSGNSSTNPSQPYPETQRVQSACTKVCGRAGMRSCAKTILCYVYLASNPANRVKVYAMLDDQSNTSLVSSSLLDELDASGPEVEFLLTTCSRKNSRSRGRQVEGLVIESVDSSTAINLPPVLEMQTIPSDKAEIATPEVVRAWPHLRFLETHIPPLDPTAAIDILVGRDAPRVHKVRESANGPDQAPWAQRLDIGWVVVGEVCPSIITPGVVTVYRTDVSDIIGCPSAVHVKPSYQQPEREFTDTLGLSIEDQRFLEWCEQGIHVNPEGKVELPLPVRPGEASLPNNFQLAESRMHTLTKTLNRKPTMKKDYLEFMGKIISRGHAEPAPDPSQSPPGKTWYLPHFAIYNPKKPERIRVVFDSAAELDGKSLNSILIPGPDQANSLLGVLMRFRQESVAVSCDVEQMFYCFHVNSEDRDLLRFLWYRNNDPNGPIVNYRMKAHPFGNNCSPALATFALRKIVSWEQDNATPEVRDFVNRQFYVDDGLISVRTPEEAIRLISDTREVLAKYGVRLHKIASNSIRAMEAFHPSERASDLRELDLTSECLPNQRSLGVVWDMECDNLKLSVNVPNKALTRRGLLAVIGSLYDPLGMIAPVVIAGRMILHQLTQGNASEIPWDEPIPTTIQQKWITWKHSLTSLQDLAIPRCYHPPNFGLVTRIEVHAFSDASQDAIAQEAFLRLFNAQGDAHVSFFIGKARVAPQKVVSIPRLELCAAALSAETVSAAINELNYKIDETRYYTDSRVVLGYVQNEAKRFQVFVSNRVNKIRALTSPEQWFYVPSSMNPADLASRSVDAAKLESSIWLSGPEFLWKQSHPPDQPFIPPLDENDPELRKSAKVYATQTGALPGSGNLGAERFKRFSSWSRAKLGVAALIHRAKRLNKTLEPDKKPADLMDTAGTLIVKTVQAECFKDERTVLCTVADSGAAGRVKRASPLSDLDPFLDHEGIIRVGGRLKNSTLPYPQRHPVILPKRTHVSDLIIGHHHVRVHHQGRNTTLHETRRQGIWIISGRSQVGNYIRRCVNCKRLRGSVTCPKMADLPQIRTEPSAPFTNVGIDVFGPWEVKVQRTTSTRRVSVYVKRWALIVTCLSSRAVDLEILSSMDTSSFINAFRRIICRRGPMDIIRSDCGSNFIGAINELRSPDNPVDVGVVIKFLAERNCRWILNPPHASHYGGVWERMIGIVRRILDAMFLSHKEQLTDDILTTFLAEAAYSVNSRPISVVSPDAADPIPVCPNDLLTGKQTTGTYDPERSTDFVRKDLYGLRRWRCTQYLADQFWRRWRREYLNEQQRQEKWLEPIRTPPVGDIVLVDEDTHRRQWPMGRISRVVVSEDGLTRSVYVKTQNYEYFRPASRTVLLVPADEAG